VGSSQQRFAFESQLSPGGLHELCAKLPLARGQAVLRYRQLADTNPATYGPDLARALSVITQIRVTSRSELPEALAAIRESVAIYRQMAAKTPTAFAGDFKHSLATAVDVLEDLGEREQAASLNLLVEAGDLDDAANLLFPPPESG
jgi:hypothetical protein